MKSKRIQLYVKNFYLAVIKEVCNNLKLKKKIGSISIFSCMYFKGHLSLWG